MSQREIRCVLYGRNNNRITDTVVMEEVFCAASDNPFPCSKLISAIYSGGTADFLYRVNEAPEFE